MKNILTINEFFNFKKDKFKDNKNWAIAYETYRAGSEGAGMFKDGFKSKESALKYLRKKVGKLEPFTHEWNDTKGDWYMPKEQLGYGLRKYYCIFEINKK